MSQQKSIPLGALLAIGALALAASIVSGREPPAVATAGEPPAALERVDLAALKLARALDPVTDVPVEVDPPFVSLGSLASLKTHPESAAPPRAAARITPPPLPFTYLGQMLDGGKTTIFVARGADHYSVEAGTMIDDAYKVERVTDTQITFVFVPSGTRQVLTVPSLKGQAE